MKIKNDMDLENIREDCQTENDKTAQFSKWLAKQGDRTKFWSKNSSFVIKTLEEFSQLGPSALESIFDHKFAEILKLRSEKREEIYQQR